MDKNILNDIHHCLIEFITNAENETTKKPLMSSTIKNYILGIQREFSRSGSMRSSYLRVLFLTVQRRV